MGMPHATPHQPVPMLQALSSSSWPPPSTTTWTKRNNEFGAEHTSARRMMYPLSQSPRGSMPLDGRDGEKGMDRRTHGAKGKGEAKGGSPRPTPNTSSNETNNNMLSARAQKPKPKPAKGQSWPKIRRAGQDHGTRTSP